jgi:Lamin Tail Domain
LLRPRWLPALCWAPAALPASVADHNRYHSQDSQVVLGAIQYDSPGRDNRTHTSLCNEWVTVVNTGRSDVNLSGWSLSDVSHHTYRFKRLCLAGHSAARVHTRRRPRRDTTANV